MAAYCYFDILRIHDEAGMQQYREQVLDTVDRYGGRYIVIGGPFEIREGDESPVFPVLIEFASLEKARAWYDSEEYKPLKAMRLQATVSRAVFYQGL